MQGHRYAAGFRRTIRATSVLLAIGGSALLGACSDAQIDARDVDRDLAGPPVGLVRVAGVVQKGPFMDLQVQARALNNPEQPPQQAEIGDGGKFELELQGGQPFLLEASGTFVDELSQDGVRLDRPMTALLVPMQDTVQNINVLTHAVAQFSLDQADSPDAQALQAARVQVLPALGFAADANPALLDLNNIADGAGLGDPNLRLLLVSAGLMSLPRPDGQMPDFWLDFGFEDGQPPAVAFEDLAGLDAVRLLDRLRQAGVVDVPDVQVADNTSWTCDSGVCDFLAVDFPGFRIAGQAVHEGDGVAVARVRRTGDTTARQTVRVQTADGTAMRGTDYLATTADLEFAPGQDVADFRVPLLIDAVAEADEAFEVRIVSVTPDSLVNRSRATIDIVDGVPAGLDQQPTASLSVAQLCVIDAAPTTALQGMQCANPADSLFPVFDGEQPGLRAAAVLQSDCTQAICAQNLRSYQLDLFLEASDALGNPQGGVAAGQYRYRGRDLLRGNDTPNATPQLNLALQGDPVAGLVQAAAANDWALALRTELRGQAPQTAQVDLPLPVPLARSVAFGDRQALLDIAANPRLRRSSNCPAGALELSGRFNPQADTLPASPDNQFDGAACVQLGTGEAFQVQATATQADIAVPGTRWPLPPGHGAGIQVVGVALPVASTTLTIPAADGTGTNLLFTETLPVGLQLNGGRLTEQGLVLDHGGLQYFNAPFFSPQDPRSSDALRANDVLYRNSGGGGSLLLAEDGLQGTISLAGGVAGLAYPDTLLNWQGFAQTLAASEPTTAVPVQVSVRLDQRTRCRSGDCAADDTRVVRANGTVLLDPAGHAVGVLSSTADTTPAFGQRTASDVAFARPADIRSGDTVTAAWAGHRVPANRPAAALLPGHLEPAGQRVVLHDTRSPAFERGNFAPAGLSVGPQLYADAQGQPVIGTGRSLAGLPLTLFNGAESTDLSASIGTKYVLRPGGFTGVFNADPRALADPIVYNGYALAMSRFAWRATDNALDPMNWIDGGFNLPGDAGLDDILFENLVLDCSGQFDGGRLVAEACDGTDDNGNQTVDENCPAILSAWQMDTQLLSMRFGGPDGAPARACSSDVQTVALGQDVTAAALSAPVAMELGWTPAGSLTHQQARGLGKATLEAGDNAEQAPGFGVQLRDAALAVDNVSGADRNRYGWLQGSTDVALPFWSGLDADFRVANRLEADTPVGEPSVLVPKGKLALFDAAQANGALAAELPDSDNAVFDVRYDWGNTGLGFQLPAFFTPASVTDTALPTFIGKRREADLVVVNLGAGINFIEPVRTKFSLGASADIQAIREFEFQVDLASGGTLSKVDTLLVETGVVPAPILEPTLARARDSLNLFNRYADRGLDELTERALLLGVTRLGEELAPVSPFEEDPFVTVSAGLAQLHSLPDQVMGFLRSEVYDQALDALNLVEDRIRDPLVDVKQDLRNLDTGNSQADTLRTRVMTVQDSVSNVRADYDALVDTLRKPLEDAKTVLVSAVQAVDRVQAAVGQVEQALIFAADFSAQVCMDANAPTPETSGYLDALFDQLDAARTLLQIAQGTELLVPLIELAADDPVLAQAMRDGQATLQTRAEELDMRLTEATGRIRMAVCTGTVDQALTEVRRVLDQYGPQLDAAQANLGLALDAVNEINGVITEIDTLGDKTFATVTLILTEFDRALAERQATTTGQDLERQLEAAFEDIYTSAFEGTVVASSEVNAFARIDADEVDPFDIVFGRIRDRLTADFNILEQTLRVQFAALLPGAAYTPDELREMLVGLIMQSEPVRNLREVANAQIDSLQEKINELVLQLTDQINVAVQGALAKVEGRVNAVLDAATAPLNKVPLNSARIDGFAVIAGNELERAHVGAEFEIPSSTEGEPGKSFGAAIDAVSWSANNKDEGCDVAVGESRLDVTISATNIPATFGTSQITMKKVYLGFTLDQAAEGIAPKGVFGGLQTQGEIGFTEFIIYDPGFAAGFGDKEIYIGARAGAVFSTIAAELAFFAGKTCNQDILLELDPTVAQFIPLPANGFAGVYARGAASIPVYSNGCPLTLGVAADIGGWILAGPPTTIGGIVGGGAFGKVGCVGALRGQLRALGSINTDGDMVFVGEGFGAAGVGLCEPAGWTSIERSRADTLCATADARIQAGYVNGWSLIDLDLSAVH